MTQLLLEQGADILKQDNYGSTALPLAAEFGHDGLVKQVRAFKLRRIDSLAEH